MERLCVSHDCHRLGCDVEMVQSNVGEYVRYEDAQAEIAKLRADIDAARRDRNSAVECAEVLRGYVADGKAEIAKLRAEVDFNDRTIQGFVDMVAALKQQLAAARAALDGEREALSAAHRALANISGCGGCESCGDIASKAFACIDARRAAEAKASRGGEG